MDGPTDKSPGPFFGTPDLSYGTATWAFFDHDSSNFIDPNYSLLLRRDHDSDF